MKTPTINDLDRLQISIARLNKDNGVSVDVSLHFDAGDMHIRNGFTSTFKTMDAALASITKLCNGIPDIMKGGEV